jgi:hypothetical protein
LVTSEVLPVRITPAERKGVNELVQRQLAALHATGANITATSVVRGLIRRELLAQRVDGFTEAPAAPLQQSFFQPALVEAAPAEVVPVVEAAPVEAAPVVKAAPISWIKPKAPTAAQSKTAPKQEKKPR